MQIGNENPARHAGAAQPGAHRRRQRAEVSVTDRGFQRLLASLDNSGNDRTGHWRATLGWQHANLTDHDDMLALQYQTSPTHPSRVDVRSLGYRLPLYGPRMVFDAYAARSSVDGGSTATVRPATCAAMRAPASRRPAPAASRAWVKPISAWPAPDWRST